MSTRFFFHVAQENVNEYTTERQTNYELIVIPEPHDIINEDSSDQPNGELQEILKKLKIPFPKSLDSSIIVTQDEMFHFFLSYLIKKKTSSKLFIIKLFEWFSNFKFMVIYLNVDIPFRKGLYISIINCSVKINFSCLKRVKNYLRNQMEKFRLTDIVILNIESEIATKISYDTLIVKFSEAKMRKKKFT